MKLVRKFFIGSLIVIGTGLALQGIAQDLKLNPIKPGSNTALTDEQQAILAVRTAKASVVNIVGLPSTTPVTASSAPIIATTPQGISGTGFIISSDGLIVTNNHVVEQTDLNYTVIFSDGTQFPATILGTDKYDDVALLKIQDTGLTPAKLGNSDALETGQTVFAIGNSLGRYQNTVTRGVVSGLSRAVDPPNTYSPVLHNWIQTDASINLGNSGGPLIDMAGEVIGMDTLVDTEGTGLGFAVPVNTIKDAVNQLQTFGKVSRPFLGVTFRTIDKALQASQNLSANSGALILSVADGTPAKLSGILQNDIITGVDAYVLNSKNTLDLVIQKYQAGNQVTLKIIRGSQHLELPVVIGEIK